jgi:hypothetical protein
MIEGVLEALRPDGVFFGWLRDTDSPTPAVLQIHGAGQVVATAVALAFRRDLLAGGHGHGHYGFAARLQVALAPGAADFELVSPGGGRVVGARLTVPAMAAGAQADVESLLRRAAAWTCADLAAAPGCIGAEAQRAAMGTARFVDVTFQFVLCRWPSADEALVFRRALDEERLSPQGFLLELLGSRERADLGDQLASPWDPEYPYGQAVPTATRRRRREAA